MDPLAPPRPSGRHLSATSLKPSPSKPSPSQRPAIVVPKRLGVTHSRDTSSFASAPVPPSGPTDPSTSGSGVAITSSAAVADSPCSFQPPSQRFILCSTSGAGLLGKALRWRRRRHMGVSDLTTCGLHRFGRMQILEAARPHQARALLALHPGFIGKWRFGAELSPEDRAPLDTSCCGAAPSIRSRCNRGSRLVEQSARTFIHRRYKQRSRPSTEYGQPPGCDPAGVRARGNIFLFTFLARPRTGTSSYAAGKWQSSAWKLRVGRSKKRGIGLS